MQKRVEMFVFRQPLNTCFSRLRTASNRGAFTWNYTSEYSRFLFNNLTFKNHFFLHKKKPLPQVFWFSMRRLSESCKTLRSFKLGYLENVLSKIIKTEKLTSKHFLMNFTKCKSFSLVNRSILYGVFCGTGAIAATVFAEKFYSYQFPHFSPRIFSVFDTSASCSSFDPVSSVNEDIQTKNLVQCIFVLNLAVFAAWRSTISHSSTSWRSAMEYFLTRHFVGSIENITAGRLHTLLSSAFSHRTFPHFFANMWMLYILSNCLQKHISPLDFLSIYTFTGIMSTIGQILTTRSPTLGASGAVMGLTAAQCSLNPRDVFYTILPIPGLILSSIQFFQLSVALNLVCAIWFWQKYTTIGWIGHLCGLFAGYGFCFYKQNVCKELHWGDLFNLSQKFGARDWKLSYLDCQDSLKIARIYFKLFCTSNPTEIRVFQQEILRLRMLKQTRRAFSR